MKWSIGIDVGGTKIAGGIVHRDGIVKEQWVVETPSEGSEFVLEAICDMVSKMQRYAKTHKLEVSGIGIGTAGGVDYKKGVVRNAGNINGWVDVPLKQLVEAHSGLPVYVENDTNAMTFGEFKYGAAIGHKEIICLSLGTGIGGGIITGGSLVRGAWNGAGELGHITARYDGPECRCGSKGCLQLYASGNELPKRWMEKHNNVNKVQTEITGKYIFDLKRKGNPVAEQVIEDMLEAITYNLVNLIHIFNPTLIVMGGGLIEHEKWICREVEQRISRKGLRTYTQEVSVLPVKLGSNAGIIGAAALPFEYERCSI